VTDRRLVVFDMDGTPIDSAALICAAMDAAFADHGLPAPGAARTRQIIGLSLPVAVAQLDPALDAPSAAAVVAGYKAAFVRLRAAGGEIDASPLFPGARATLQRLRAEGAVLAVATGKARRGLDHILAGHGLRDLFDLTQTADDAESKPHPGMLLNLLRAADLPASAATMVGDTTFDMRMAVAAGVRAVGVNWGCHAAEALATAGAVAVLDRFDALHPLLAAEPAP
jgi:phosphoglycolate phosphatase